MRTMALVFVAMLVVPGAASAQRCSNSCTDSYVRGSRFPYLEMIDVVEYHIQGNANPSLAQWVRIQGPNVGPSGTCSGLLHGRENFNVTIRASYAIHTTSADLTGANFETRIRVVRTDGVPISNAEDTYTRKIRANIPNRYSSQSEVFNAFVGGFQANIDYDVQLEVRLLANAVMTVEGPYVTAQGSPTIYGGNETTNAAQIAVGGSWVKIGETAMTNASAENVDLVMQSYFQVAGGTPQDQVQLGFGYDNGSSNGHNFNVYVPSSFPDGMNVFDWIPNAGITATLAPRPLQPYNIQLWAKSTTGRTVTLQNRQVSVIAFPASNGERAQVDMSGTRQARDNWDPAVHPQPHACAMLDEPYASMNPNLDSCTTTGSIVPASGTWTKLATVTIPPASSPTGYEWMAQAYVEFLGRGQTWGDTWCQIAAEPVLSPNPNPQNPYNEKSIEIGHMGITVPVQKGQAFYFGDAHRWGTGTQNTVNLWIRKIDLRETGKSVTIGRVNFSVRIVDAGTATCNQ